MRPGLIWVKSRRQGPNVRGPLFPQQGTLSNATVTLGSRAMNWQAPSVTAWRLYPSAISARLVYLREIGRMAFWDFCNTICQQPTSFDQFSCLYEERVRYRDAKGFCGLEIYHEIELGRLQDRQVGGLLPF
jgi:hypothetical protein